MEKYIKRLILISAVILVLGIVLMYATANFQMIIPFLVGWAVSFANSVIGIIVITRAFKTSGKGFFNTILLSMVVRMFSIVAIVALLIILLKIDKINLAVSLFLFYFLFLILEINFLQTGVKANENVSQ
ncbi:MAG: hypothetical protein IPG02_06385 [Ignavibacteria bacterium]|nr:hypothetical protein [Ignavibacteria bacterium]MBK9228451.1 hypothetical protein [Ignavibacteria bacterium]